MDGAVTLNFPVIAGLVLFVVGVNRLHKAMTLWQSRDTGTNDWFGRWLFRVTGAEKLPRSRAETWLQMSQALFHAIVGGLMTAFALFWLFYALDFS